MSAFSVRLRCSVRRSREVPEDGQHAGGHRRQRPQRRRHVDRVLRRARRRGQHPAGRGAARLAHPPDAQQEPGTAGVRQGVRDGGRSRRRQALHQGVARSRSVAASRGARVVGPETDAYGPQVAQPPTGDPPRRGRARAPRAQASSAPAFRASASDAPAADSGGRNVADFSLRPTRGSRRPRSGGRWSERPGWPSWPSEVVENTVHMPYTDPPWRRERNASR